MLDPTGGYRPPTAEAAPASPEWVRLSREHRDTTMVGLQGQHPDPGSRALRVDVDGVDSTTAASAARRPPTPAQRRPTPPGVAAAAGGYHHGRRLDDLARGFGVHRRTEADHLERLAIARSVHLPKLTPTDLVRAVSQYQAGDSLATVGKT